METLKHKNRKYINKFLFITIFSILGLISLQLPLSRLVGSSARFTLFDLLAPTVGAFIGIVPGILAILIVQTINTLVHGGFVDVGAVIRLFPTLFAVAYFARKSKAILFVPLLAMLAFLIHPEGQKAWQYSLFWLIPVAMYFLQDRFLLARSIGATFTAHAVGGALWIWAFNLPSPVWYGLIPVVIVERLFFTVGISAVYVLITNVLQYLVNRKYTSLPFFIEKRYLWRVNK